MQALFLEYIQQHPPRQILHKTTLEPIPSENLCLRILSDVKIGNGASGGAFIVYDPKPPNKDIPHRTVCKIFEHRAQFDQECLIVFVIEYSRKKRKDEPDYIHFYIPHFYQRYRKTPYYVQMEHLNDTV